MVDVWLAQILRWVALLGVCALPFLLSMIGLLMHQRAAFRGRGTWLPVAAGPWLEAKVAALGVPVLVEVHGREGMDAYIPGVSTIGLSGRTWGGSRPGDWAIAAHELGHAQNMALHAVIRQLLPFARLAQGLLWRSFCAALVCAALLGEPFLLPLALGLLVASVATTAVVCADEAKASWHGHRLLCADPRIRGADLRVAAASMASAGSVYALGLMGQLAALALWPVVADVVPLLADRVVFVPGPIAMWLTVVLVPVLLLRAAHVIGQVLSPEPVTTDFRLFTVMHREGQWEFLTGIGVLVLVVGLYPMLPGPWAALAFVLATMTAIGPAGGLLAALILFPLLLMARRWFEEIDAEDDAFFPRPNAPDETAPALMALYTDPPWYLRLGWLARLAYLPLLAALVTHAFLG